MRTSSYQLLAVTIVAGVAGALASSWIRFGGQAFADPDGTAIPLRESNPSAAQDIMEAKCYDVFDENQGRRISIFWWKEKDMATIAFYDKTGTFRAYIGLDRNGKLVQKDGIRD